MKPSDTDRPVLYGKLDTPAKRTAFCGVLAALALIFSYVEALVPVNAGMPGIKLGIANLAVLAALYTVGERPAWAVNCCRMILAAALFGSLYSALYAFSGAVLAYEAMLITKRSGLFSPAGVSMAGGSAHNLGQLLCAAAVTRTPGILAYFPVLLISGLACGLVNGLLCCLVLPRLEAAIR